MSLLPNIITRLKALESQVSAFVQGVTAHGSLTELSADDHPQYHNNARGDARYYTKGHVDSIAASIPDQLTDLDTTVTGAQLNADHTKLGLIEPQATADQTASEIRTLYDSTRVFKTVSGTYTAVDGDRLVADVSTANTTVILPAAGEVTISRIGVPYVLTIQGVVNGLTNPTLDYDGNSVTLAYITSEWRKI